MDSTLKGKIALVTGASRGIGAATAKALGSRGTTVAVHYSSNKDQALEVCREIEKSGGKAFAVAGDLSSMKGITQLVEGFLAELENRFKSAEFDILINNAGIAPIVEFEATDEATFDKIMAVNVKAPFFITQKLAKHIRPGGRVIITSSVVAYRQFPGIVAYSTSKGAIEALRIHLAPLFGARGITVNTVNPGAINTDMNPWLESPEGVATVKSNQALQRVGNAEDISEVMAFVASPASGWITGQKIDVSGGTKL